MNNSHLFCTKSISMSICGRCKPQKLLVAAKHILRVHHAEYVASNNIWVECTHCNTVLHGPTHVQDGIELANDLKMKCTVWRSDDIERLIQSLEVVS